MKKIIAFLLCMCLLSGCCAANKFSYDKTYNPNKGSQVLVGRYDNFYVINMTDGIFICSKDFSEAEQLTNEYCYFPYIYEDKIYYVGEDDDYNPRIESVGIRTGNSEWLYSGINITYFAPTNDGWILIDEERLVKLRKDGMKLFETEIPEIGHAKFSNDNFLLYSTLWETETIMMYNFTTKEATEVFTIDGHIGENILCDGEYIYYTVLKDMKYYDFCMYNLNTKETVTLITNKFSEEFVVWDNMCYYYLAEEDGGQYIKAFNMSTKEITTLKTIDYEIFDINILDNQLFYRRTHYGKQLEMLNLADNSTKYLYEVYSDITKRVP